MLEDVEGTVLQGAPDVSFTPTWGNPVGRGSSAQWVPGCPQPLLLLGAICKPTQKNWRNFYVCWPLHPIYGYRSLELSFQAFCIRQTASQTYAKPTRDLGLEFDGVHLCTIEPSDDVEMSPRNKLQLCILLFTSPMPMGFLKPSPCGMRTSHALAVVEISGNEPEGLILPRRQLSTPYRGWIWGMQEHGYRGAYGQQRARNQDGPAEQTSEPLW